MLSDDAIGPLWALIGFGVDTATVAEPNLLAVGQIWRPDLAMVPEAQALHLAPPERRLEALDEALLPRNVPLGWVALVRPDRCVMAEGPVDRTNQFP